MTVFGPGVGECIVLHLGNGDWLVVDSCLDPETRMPVAMTYLTGMGLKPSDCIRGILATHWHDDHIRGLSTLVAECPEAAFMMATALGNDQFYTLVLEARESNLMIKQTSSAHEFSDILDGLMNCGKCPQFVHDGCRVFLGGHNHAVKLWALSPSSASIANALKNLAEKLLDNTRKFKRFSPNDLSIVVLVDAGTHSLLLGADLENTREEAFGWKAVLSSGLTPQRQSNAFKVSHHGAVNGDHAEVWNSRLRYHPIAVVAPYLKLVDPLPTRRDVERIKGYTGNSYCTSAPTLRKPVRRPGVDGIMGTMTRSRRAVIERAGFVRLRVDLTDSAAEPRIEIFGTAFQM